MIWKELIKNAHIGTEKIHLDFKKYFDSDDKLYLMLKEIEYANNEEMILNYSIIVSTYFEVGIKPLKLTEKPVLNKVPVDNRQTVNFSDYLINSIFDELNNNYTKLQEIFLKEIINRNQVIPENFIVKFLDIGTKVKQLRPYISLILNKKALRISAKKEEWNYIYDIDKDLKELWLEDSTFINIQPDIIKNSLINNYHKFDEVLDLINNTWNSLDKNKKNDLFILIDKLNNQIPINEYNLYKNTIINLGLNDKDIKSKIKELQKKENNENNENNGIIDNDQFIINNIEKIINIVDKSLVIKDKYSDNVIFKFNNTIFDKLLKSENIKLDINHDNIFKTLIKYIPLNYWENKFGLLPENIIKSFMNNGYTDLLIQVSHRVLKEKNTNWAESLFINEILYNNLNHLLTDEFKNEYFNKVLKSLNIEDINNIKLLNTMKKSGLIISEKEEDLLKNSTNSINKYITNLSRVLKFYDKFSFIQSKDIINHLLFLLIPGNFNFYAFHDLAYKLDPEIINYLKEQVEKNKISFAENMYFFKSIYNIIRLRCLFNKEKNY